MRPAELIITIALGAASTTRRKRSSLFSSACSIVASRRVSAARLSGLILRFCLFFPENAGESTAGTVGTYSPRAKPGQSVEILRFVQGRGPRSGRRNAHRIYDALRLRVGRG